jgi:hypothetical protein
MTEMIVQESLPFPDAECPIIVFEAQEGILVRVYQAERVEGRSWTFKRLSPSLAMRMGIPPRLNRVPSLTE